MRDIVDGFWLPREIKKRLLDSGTEFQSLSFYNGQPCEPEAEGAITVRWPQFTLENYSSLFEELENNRKKAPTGLDFWNRFQAALKKVQARFANASDPLRMLAL